MVRELLLGTTRFNDLRRGVPRMSPALLSKRLKELERAGVVIAAPNGQRRHRVSSFAEAGEDFRPVVLGIGSVGAALGESQLTLRNLDPALLMWDMRRNLNPKPLPQTHAARYSFCIPELPEAKQNYWLVVDGTSVDLCGFDPGFDVDLLVTSSLKSMTAIWMGLTQRAPRGQAGNLEFDGDPKIASAMQQWLGLSTFAAEQRKVS